MPMPAVLTARRAGFRFLAFVTSFALASAAAPVVLRAQYEPPIPAYNAPTHYYDAATGAGFTLRTNLHNIISTGFRGVSYGDQRYAMGTGAVSGAPSSGGTE